MTLPIVHHPAYVAPTPSGHRFPMSKFARLIEVLAAEGGTVAVSPSSSGPGRRG